MQDKNDKHNISGGTFANTADEFSVRSATSAVGFNFDYAPPPQSMYIGVDDQLLIQIIDFAANQSVNVSLRILRPDGKILPMNFLLPTNGLRTTQTSRFALAEGWLLSCTAASNAGLSPGSWTYVAVSLTRAPFGNQASYCTLISQYVNRFAAGTWPYGQFQRPTDGPGVPRSVNQAAPAAGADFVITVPGSARWRLVTFRATLTTAVAAANRLVHIVTDDGASILMDSPSNFTQVASIVNTYSAFDSAPYMNVPFDLTTVQPLTSNQFMVNPFRIRTLTTGIQAADQWSAAQFEVMEWAETV